jgi:hypothetical protein
MRIVSVSSDDPDIASHLLDLAVSYDQLTDDERAYYDEHVAAIERRHEPAGHVRPRGRRVEVQTPAPGTPTTSA